MTTVSRAMRFGAIGLPAVAGQTIAIASISVRTSRIDRDADRSGCPILAGFRAVARASTDGHIGSTGPLELHLRQQFAESITSEQRQVAAPVRDDVCLLIRRDLSGADHG